MGSRGLVDAFHLPGLADDPARPWLELDAPGSGTLARAPRLRPVDIAAVCRRLRAAREARLPGGDTQGVIETISAAASILREEALQEDTAAAIAGLSGVSRPMFEHVLTRMAEGWTAEALRGLVAAEFGAEATPARFAPDPTRPGVRRRVVAPELAFHVFAGNVLGVAVTSLIRSLLVGSAVLGKAARREPVLPALFARALGRVDAALAECVAVTWWPGGSTQLESAALDQATLAVVYGGEETVRAVRALAPARVRLVEHGPAISVGLVFRDALSEQGAKAAARSAARATAAFDQRGCTSPVAVLVEDGGAVSPARFTELVADELAGLSDTLPPGPLGPAEAARRRQVLDAAELRSAESGAPALAGSGWGVFLDRELRPEEFCTGRVLQVVPMSSVEDGLRLVGRLAGSVQTAGVAGGPAHVAEALASLGVSRITGLGDMPWPPPAWRHDGGLPLGELVRWIDLEI
ncbi:MAG: acyl-CoA reductase [Gemmatimonadota bacterium]